MRKPNWFAANASVFQMVLLFALTRPLSAQQADQTTYQKQEPQSLTASQTGSASASPSADQIRADAAKAIGSQLAFGSWTFKGITNRRGLWQTFAMIADTGFRYRIDVQGPLHQSDGFDGRLSWKLGASGVSHPTILTDREIPRIVASVIAGSWTSPGAPFAFHILPSDADSIKLEMKCLGGRVPAILFLNPKTYRVEQLMQIRRRQNRPLRYRHRL